MNRRQSVFPVELVALIVIALIAIQPFLSGRMPLSADGELHLYRQVALDHSLRVDGAIWPRYSSGMAYGFGAPLFNYFPPTSYYLPQLLHIFGMSFQVAWLWGLALYTVMAAGGAFLLGRIWTNGVGGLLTATAYIYSPYFLFDTVSRGTSSEIGGMAILPFVLWALKRLADYGRARDMVLSVLSLAVFIPMHNIVTLHGMILIVIYSLVLWLTAINRRPVFFRLLIAGVLGLVITSFFWLPALGETAYVKVNSIVESLSHIDPAEHLRPLTDILAPPFTADPTRMQTPVPISLGWVQIMLAIGALIIALLKGSKRVKWIIIVLLSYTLMVIYLNTGASEWAWDTLPLIGYTQFAWRTWSAGTIALALLAGIGGALLYNLIASRLRSAWVGGAVAIMIVYAIPWTYVNYVPDYAADDIRDFQAFERRTGSLTGSSYAEYMPIWNEDELDPDVLADAFASADVIQRLTPPDGVTIIEQSWQATAAQLQLDVQEASRLVFDWMYMPGWVAFVDGEPVDVQSESPQGFVSVDIPAGMQSLEISKGLTALESSAEILSLTGAILLLIVIILGDRFSLWEAPDYYQYYSHSHCPAVIGVVLVITVLKFGVLDRIDSPLRIERFADGYSTGTNIPLQTNFDNQIQLIVADLPVGEVDSGGTEPVTLYWRLMGDKVQSDYSSILHLIDRAGNLVMEYGSFMPGELATGNWLPDHYIQETIELFVPCGVPPGEYTLDAGLYLPETKERLNVINAAGNPEDVRVTLGKIIVKHPGIQTMDVPVIDSPYEVVMTAATGIPSDATVGDEVNLLWDWVSTVPPSQDYSAKLVWFDENGQSAAEISPLELTLDYPTSLWKQRELWTGRHRFYVPASLDSGTYDVGVQLLDRSGGAVGDVVITDIMQVSTPERSYEIPDEIESMRVRWANGIVLMGVSRVGENLTLYWRTDSLIDESLRLFVHAVGGNEQIVSQTDGVPVNWMRPTTGWAVDEVIATEHNLIGIESALEIRVGWYFPFDGQRIPLDASGDYWSVELQQDQTQ